jgi:flagellar P-ring protein precursor FlgI
MALLTEINMRMLHRGILVLSHLFFLILAAHPVETSAARLKDIATVKGVRTNQLMGYGLVIGLNGTGDGTGTKFTTQSLVNMLERLGIHALPDQVKVKNVAAVMVTADFPPFARIGNSLDVLVSSIGDAQSLQGGTLMMTTLKGIDNQTYAVAQGPLLVGGFASSGEAGGGVQKNHPTVGRIPGGATIEREIPFEFNRLGELVISLHEPDFTTAERLAKAINAKLGGEKAHASDPGTVKIDLPGGDHQDLVSLVASLEQLEVNPDRRAKVILAERTGTVIIGENVRVSPVAIAHGNLSVEIKEKKDVSQPAPFAQRGKTVVTKESSVSVTEEQRRLLLVESGASLGELVKALNAIGVSPRDLITVFQAIKAAGALQADLEII